MLYACDKILSASDDPVWKDVIKAQLRAHKTYLTSEEFIKSEEITWYGEELYQLYKEEFKLKV
jgi:sialic acid synthase SpsE